MTVNEAEVEIRWEQWAAVLIVFFSTLPVVIGTLISALPSSDLFSSQETFKSAEKLSSNRRQRLQLITQFLISCSLQTTTKKLFKINQSQTSNAAQQQHQFAFINGVRALGALAVLIGHTLSLFPLYGQSEAVPISGYPDVLQNITGKQLAAQPFFNGVLFVQTFFTISGMLLSYHGLIHRISLLPYIVLRVARYLPPLIGTICLSLSAELAFPFIRPFSKQCLGGGWWRNFLFISNYSNLNDQCAPHTWYLSAEMQLHVLAFALLFTYQNFSSKVTFLVSGLLCTVGAVAIFTIIALGLSPVILQQIHLYSQYEFRNDFFNLLYLPPYNYFVAYFSGAILGQLLLEKKVAWTKSINFNNQKSFHILSLLSTAVLLTWPFLTYPLAKEDRVLFTENRVLLASIYTAYHLIWSLATFFLFFRCTVQPSWALARFLSASAFQPLSRLSFSLYLVHYLMIRYSVLRTNSILHLENTGEFEKLLCLIIVYSLALAYAFHAVFEVPAASALKLLINKDKSDKLQTNNVNVKNK